MTTPDPAAIPINTFQDILDALEQHPRLGETLSLRLNPTPPPPPDAADNEIRKLLTRLAKNHERTEARHDRMEGGQADLSIKLNRIEILLERNLETLTADRYQAKAARNLDAIARAAGLYRLKPLVTPLMPNDQTFMGQLEDAVSKNRINETQADDIKNAAAIAQAHDPANHQTVYLVAEASLKDGKKALMLSQRRALVLHTATGKRTIYALFTPNINEEIRSMTKDPDRDAIAIPLKP